MSDSDHWRRISELFDELCELAPADRERRLEILATADPGTAAELRRMLRADDAIDPRVDQGFGAFLDAEIAGSLEGALTRTGDGVDATAAGDRIGPWRLVRRLGRGGMGEVWEAVRVDGEFEQTVALKLLRRGLDTEDVLDRFLRERRLLARLQHPKIARLFDGGSTPDGRPWFAMERVRGAPLTDYCEHHGLDLEARLQLFLEVCEAVEHAHRSLVIHRDLKPSNILVDDSGEVKLLDFGIAKLVGGDEADIASTRTGLRVLTPSHAAPEQIQGQGLTLATDVYALGVVLYELVTGRLPHRRTESSGHGFAEGTSHETVTRPSIALERDDVERRVGEDSPARLARRVAGDLDTIVLKALARDPERRYATVHALADEIRRHLTGQPILARPDSWAYRGRKFVRRHARGVAATAATLMLFLATVGWYTGRLAGERDRARSAAERAETQFERAELGRIFLVRLIESANPMLRAAEGPLTAVDLLRAARDRVETELPDEPELQAELRLAVANALRGMGEIHEALELSETSLGQLRGLALTETRPYYVGLSNLAQLRSEAGDLEGAETAVREAIAIMESLPDSPELARALVSANTGLSTVLSARGREHEAQDVREATLAARARLLDDPEHPDLAVDWYNLGIGHQNLGRNAAAEHALREAEHLLILGHGESHPRLINVWLALSSLLAVRGDFIAAESSEHKAGRLLDERFTESHPLRHSLLQIRARRLLLTGEDGAADAAVRAVELGREDSPQQLAAALSILGAAELSRGRYERAATAFGESYSIQSTLRGEAAVETRLPAVGRGLAHWRATGRKTDLDAAEATLEAMLQDGQEDSREFGDAAAWLSAALDEVAPDRAAAWRLRAERALAERHPPGHPWRASLAGTRR